MDLSLVPLFRQRFVCFVLPFFVFFVVVVCCSDPTFFGNCSFLFLVLNAEQPLMIIKQYAELYHFSKLNSKRLHSSSSSFIGQVNVNRNQNEWEEDEEQLVAPESDSP